MESTFRCRACGFDVPLGDLELAGAVVCARCGLEQAFEKRVWHDAFDLAHAVADGTLTVVKKQAIAGENGMRVTAMPHAPRCAVCEGPIEVRFEEGRAIADCKACASSTAYVVPQAAARMTKDALRAALVDAHRADAAPVKVADTEGAIAIQCPSCNASLDADATTKFVECKYCKTKSRIPERTWLRLKGGEPKAVTMWLALAGDSRAKRDAAREREKDAQDELVKQIRAAKRAAAEEEARKKEEDERRRRAAEEAARAEKEREVEPERARVAEVTAQRGSRATAIVVGCLLLAVVAVGVAVAMGR